MDTDRAHPLYKEGFKQKNIFRDDDGEFWTSWYNSRTKKFKGGKPSSHQENFKK